VPALALYTSLGFVPEKRLHRFYLNGKDAFRLVLPLAGAEDAATAAASSDPHRQYPRPSALLPPPPRRPPGALASSASSDDDDDASFVSATPGDERAESADEEDYAEDTTRLLRLRRRVAALRACRMIKVWPAEDGEDRVSGR